MFFARYRWIGEIDRKEWAALFNREATRGYHLRGSLTQAGKQLTGLLDGTYMCIHGVGSPGLVLAA